MGKVLDSAGAAVGDGPGVPLAVLGWGATAAGYLATAANDELDDLIVTARGAYHLVRQLDGPAGQPLLIYLRLERPRANLAVARRALANVRVGPEPVAPQRNATEVQETPAQGGNGSGTQGAAVAVATRPAATRTALPRRHQVAALPMPRRPTPTPTPPPRPQPRAGPAPSAVLPSVLPRRVAEAPPPAARVTGPPSRSGPRWADDVSTMQRLLTALRRLR
jgi:hypothetical protein